MKSQIERWRDIEGFEGLYKVSDYGAVKSVNYNHTGEEKILKGVKETNSYLLVTLYKNGMKKMFLIHRLVAEAFLPNPKNLPQVNHKDENKFNNHLENLEWCTSKYNINYSQSKPVKQYSLDGKFLKVWPSATEVERETDFNQGNISKCCNGKQKTAYGYKWSY